MRSLYEPGRIEVFELDEHIRAASRSNPLELNDRCVTDRAEDRVRNGWKCRRHIVYTGLVAWKNATVPKIRLRSRIFLGETNPADCIICTIL